MPKKYIITPIDGATNIKLEVLDFDTFETVFTKTTQTPVKTFNGLQFNCSGTEFDWFDRTISKLPQKYKNVSVIAPAARGASGGLVGKDSSLIEVLGQNLTLAYTQRYPKDVEKRFQEITGSGEKFYKETGSVRDLPGSLTLLKRFIFEELKRPELLKKSAGFGTYGILISGHFLGNDYLKAVTEAGNEHSYWMCHTGARDVNKPPGTLSSAAQKVESFKKLVPEKQVVCYNAIDKMPSDTAKFLDLNTQPLIIPGGHDTCLSHIPIISTFYKRFPEKKNKPAIQVDAGTWTMTAQIGGKTKLPEKGYQKDIIVQGTVDGEPVVTAKYGGGNDFRYLNNITKLNKFYDQNILVTILSEKNIFVLPNINPDNYGTGPFPTLKGRIINKELFFNNPTFAYVTANLTTALTTSYHIEEISQDKNIPVIITAGGSKDELYGRLITSITDREVFAMFDKNGNPISETTTLGAAIAGKAAFKGTHPYKVDISPLRIKYRSFEPFNNKIINLIKEYKTKFFDEIYKNTNKS